METTSDFTHHVSRFRFLNTIISLIPFLACRPICIYQICLKLKFATK